MVSKIAGDRQMYVCRMMEKFWKFMMLGEEGFKCRRKYAGLIVVSGN